MTTPLIHHVSERLPPQGQRVLAFGMLHGRSPEWHTARREHIVAERWFTHEGYSLLHDVTHWTEILPEPQSAWSESL